MSLLIFHLAYSFWMFCNIQFLHYAHVSSLQVSIMPTKSYLSSYIKTFNSFYLLLILCALYIGNGIFGSCILIYSFLYFYVHYWHLHILIFLALLGIAQLFGFSSPSSTGFKFKALWTRTARPLPITFFPVLIRCNFHLLWCSSCQKCVPLSNIQTIPIDTSAWPILLFQYYSLFLGKI